MGSPRERPNEGTTEPLDDWLEEVYASFGAFQVIPFPQDHTAIPDTADQVRLIILHDKACGAGGRNTG